MSDPHPAYPPPPPGSRGPAHPPPGNGAAVAALVLGIISASIAIIPLINFLGILLAIAGAVLGAVSGSPPTTGISR